MGMERTLFVLCATGLLSAHQFPDYEGVDSFAGLSLDSARWPKQPIDFRGKKVGIIGIGNKIQVEGYFQMMNYLATWRTAVFRVIKNVK